MVRHERLLSVRAGGAEGRRSADLHGVGRGVGTMMPLPRRRIPGLEIADHQFTGPLAHDRPGGETLSVFAREVVAIENAGKDLPWLIFFQGGPGYPGPRVLERNGWIKRAVQEFRVLLLDDRGTGRSEPVCAQTLARRGNAKERGRYLTHFRSDAIVH